MNQQQIYMQVGLNSGAEALDFMRDHYVRMDEQRRRINPLAKPRFTSAINEIPKIKQSFELEYGIAGFFPTPKRKTLGQIAARVSGYLAALCLIGIVSFCTTYGLVYLILRAIVIEGGGQW